MFLTALAIGSIIVFAGLAAGTRILAGRQCRRWHRTAPPTEGK